MLAITVKQPYASLIVHGIKTWETRSTPPNGNMRPDSVRGLPGLVVHTGARVAIHAAVAPIDRDIDLGPKFKVIERDNELLLAELDVIPHLLGNEEMSQAIANIVDTYPLPTGAVIGTANIVKALPILSDRDTIGEWDWDRDFIEYTGDSLTVIRRATNTQPEWEEPIDDQLPLAWWDPERTGWAYELVTPMPFRQRYPATGKQGVWEWDSSVMSDDAYESCQS